MKISKLIQRLQKARAEHGETDVWVWPKGSGEPEPAAELRREDGFEVWEGTRRDGFHPYETGPRFYLEGFPDE